MTGPTLILGGTAEALELAAECADRGVSAISSMAGRVAEIRRPAGAVRIGGFGGADGLARYLTGQQIAAVIDATHPFAAQITANAAQACARTGTPLLILNRPRWQPVDGDRWTVVPSLGDAARAVPELTGPDDRVLLTIGRQGASAFAGLSQRFWVRALEPPEPPLPRHHQLLLQRGPFNREDERELLHSKRIDLVVSKNSGGSMTSAKLTAARELRIPVLMIDRPPRPPGISCVSTLAEAIRWAQGGGAA